VKKLIRCRRCPNEKGQTLAEFALVLPVMLLIMCAIFEFGRAVMTLNVVTGAAREGVRVGAISSSGFSQARQAAINVLNSAGIGGYTVTVTGPDGNGDINCSVSAPHNVLTSGFIPGWSGQINISHTAVMRWEG